MCRPIVVLCQAVLGTIYQIPPGDISPSEGCVILYRDNRRHDNAGTPGQQTPGQCRDAGTMALTLMLRHYQWLC